MAYPQFKYAPKKFPAKPSLQRRDWLKMPQTNEYIFEWALKYPQGIQSCLIMGGLGAAETAQATALIESIQEVLPPRPNPKKWCFLIQIGDEHELLDFRVVPKDEGPTRVGEYRSHTLSLAPRDWYPRGQAKLMKRFHEEFFGTPPSRTEMEAFILDDDSFSISYEEALFYSGFYDHTEANG